jgi:feruloyl esterase
MQGQTANLATSCEILSSLTLPDTTITLAQTVPDGEFNQPATGGVAARKVDNLPAFCRVAATIKLPPDSNIQVEVWLPVSGWNGKFEGTGCCSSADWMATALSRGYATAGLRPSTTRQGPITVRITTYPIHEMTVKAKAIMWAYYSRGPRFSYFMGCSGGGYQGLSEAQQFPADYNGIMAGAPVGTAKYLQVAQLWNASVMLQDPSSTPLGSNPVTSIAPSQYLLINRAVLAACDAHDGVTDGLISDPTRCDFDPKTLLCPGEANQTCLTPAQIVAVQKIYSGVKNPRTGQALHPPIMRGSENAWPALTSFPFNTAIGFFKNVVFGDPTWDWRTFDFDRDLAKTDAKVASLNWLPPVDPNLKPFKRHGGKIIMWHGWNDPTISPLNSVNYYGSVSRLLGTQATDEFIRLFMVPGMEHCGGGPGPNTFDALMALEEWLEKDRAPEKMLATHSTKGVVNRTRLLCPYPQVAQYKGTGSTDNAENFICRTR